MSLLKRSGKWHFRFRFDGKRYAQTTGLADTERNKTKAQQVEAEHRQALMEGRRPSRRIQVRQFSDAAEDFLTWAAIEHRDHPNSAKRLKTSFSALKDFFGTLPVSLIDEPRIEAFKLFRVKEHDIRDITLRHDLHALSKFFGYAIKQRWTRENPVENVSIPSDKDAVRIHVVTPTEEAAYFSRAAKYPDLYDLGRLILNQGMRPEEVTALAVSDVNLETGKLTIRDGKSTSARRVLDLTTESKSILARRINHAQWIFPAKKKPAKHITRLNSAHDRLLAAALKETPPLALKFVLYDFRHTFATRFAEHVPDITALAAILGHSTIRLVQRYVHPTAEHKKSAMAKFDAVMIAGMKEYRA